MLEHPYGISAYHVGKAFGVDKEHVTIQRPFVGVGLVTIRADIPRSELPEDVAAQLHDVSKSATAVASVPVTDMEGNFINREVSTIQPGAFVHPDEIEIDTEADARLPKGHKKKEGLSYLINFSWFFFGVATALAIIHIL